MIYNLFLNAYTNAPLTNYYSAVSATDYSQRVFAIDWSFLPHDKKFKVSFKFSSRAATLTNSDQIYVTANFLPNSTTLAGGSVVQQLNTSLLGLLKVRAATPSNADMQYDSTPTDNLPVYLFGRPTNNFLEIILKTYAGVNATLTNLIWYMVISFEEVR